MKAQMASTVISVLFLNWVSDQRHAPVFYPGQRDPVPIVQEAEWAPQPLWMGAEKHAPYRY